MPEFVDLPLKTRRLTLRPLGNEDVEALYGIFSDPQVMRYWDTAPYSSREQVLQRIECDRKALLEGSALRVGIVPSGSATIIGTIAAFDFVEQSGRAEVGYILSRDAWGNGYMHEALTGLIEYLFSWLGLRRLEADVDPRNARSAKSLERLGFAREGLLRERWIVAGEISDSALYGLLKHEWLGGEAR
jgi:ribosomal-protein-alanine N-acetyltransferase